MKTIEVYKLYARTDDGRDNLPVAIFSSAKAAADAAPYAGGYPPGEIMHGTITIYDEAREWKPECDLEARESALSKLTDREKAALGVKEQTR